MFSNFTQHIIDIKSIAHDDFKVDYINKIYNLLKLSALSLLRFLNIDNKMLGFINSRIDVNINNTSVPFWSINYWLPNYSFDDLTKSYVNIKNQEKNQKITQLTLTEVKVPLDFYDDYDMVDDFIQTTEK